MGRDPQEFIDCQACEGTGLIYDDDTEEYEECILCNGSKEIHPDDDDEEDDPDREYDSRND